MKKLFSLIISVCLLTGVVTFVTMPAAAIEENESHSVPITINAEPMIFSVTMPTSFPISVSSNGNVIVATDCVIINNSAGPIIVSDVSTSGDNGWSVVDYYEGCFVQVPVDAKILAMTINNVGIATGDVASTFGTINSGAEEHFSYYGAIPAQSSTFLNCVAAHVVITVTWKTTPDPSVTQENWSEEQASSIYTWIDNGNNITITGLNPNINSVYQMNHGIDMPDMIGGKPIVSIADSAFYSCSNLQLTNLAGGITTIGDNAFRYCNSLGLKTLPSGLTSIGDYAFQGCVNLKLESLPNGVTSIGKYAFNACVDLALTKLPNGLTTINDGTFASCGNASVGKFSLTELPNTITSIGENAFARDTYVYFTEVPNTVTSIGSGAFMSCNNVRITSVPCAYGENAFYGTKCSNPTIVTP